MNRWIVSEHLKQTFMFSGRVPVRKSVFREFDGKMPDEEIEEGILEFEMVANVVVSDEQKRWTSRKHASSKKVDYRERVRG